MYKGQWKNCVKDGVGLLTYADGSQVECNFVGDFPDGRGVKTFPDGSVYKGELKDGLFHGKGKYRQPKDGSEYNGNWVKNEMKGEGVKKLNWGQVEIGGHFSYGHVNGKGYKKWRKTVFKTINGQQGQRQVKAYEWFIYRG